MNEHFPPEDQLSQNKLGEILVKARESKGLSQQAVAQKLYLSVRIIEALEAGQYKALPDKIFVKGHLKKYCELIDIEPNAAIDLLDELYIVPNKRTISLLGDYGKIKRKRKKHNDLILKVVGYLILLFIIVLVVFWWHSHDLLKRNMLTVKPSSDSLFVNHNTKKQSDGAKQNMVAVPLSPSLQMPNSAATITTTTNPVSNNDSGEQNMTESLVPATQSESSQQYTANSPKSAEPTSKPSNSTAWHNPDQTAE